MNNATTDSENGRFQTQYPNHYFKRPLRESGPLDTSSIADYVGCTRRTAYSKLRQLEEKGEVQSKEVGNSLEWYIPEVSHHSRNITAQATAKLLNEVWPKSGPAQAMVIAIHREHSQAILEGRKEIEFRRRKIATENVPDLALIYEPSPTQAIVGIFSIEKIKRLSIEKLVELGRDRTPSTRESLLDYFEGLEKGTAIFIDEYLKIQPEIPLHSNDGGEWVFNPPQDFYYTDLFDFLNKVSQSKS